MESITSKNKICGVKIRKNRWYYLESIGSVCGNFRWLFKSDGNKPSTACSKCIDVDNSLHYNGIGLVCSNDSIIYIRPATSDEVLKYFPPEKFPDIFLVN